MAADILLYRPKFIPVGDDQLQHIELTRTIARKFNAKFGDSFIEPKVLLTKTPRVMSLKDPSKKMSKSQPDSCLFIDDAPEVIHQKIARAVTDSDATIKYDPARKAGLANLIDIYAALTHMEPKTVAEEFADAKYSEFKQKLGTLVSGYFAEFREKKKILLANPKKIETMLAAGSKKANIVAAKKMEEVKRSVGLL
jgi:tryptophanyl-tRNA synthetase